MALSHKDWKLPNSWIWLAEIDIESSLDFPSRPAFRPVLNVLWRKSCKLKCKIIDYFDLTIFILWKCQKTWWGKKIQFIQLCIYYVHVCTWETTRSLILTSLCLFQNNVRFACSQPITWSNFSNLCFFLFKMYFICFYYCILNNTLLLCTQQTLHHVVTTSCFFYLSCLLNFTRWQGG